MQDLDSESEIDLLDHTGFIDLPVFDPEIEPELQIPEPVTIKPRRSLQQAKNYNKYTPYYFSLPNRNLTWKLGAFLPIEILNYLPLNAAQISAFASDLNWDMISNEEIPGPLMVLHKDKINWDIFLRNGKPKEINYLLDVYDKLLEHHSVFYNHRIKKRYYNTSFILVFPNLIDWKWLIKNKKVEECVLLKYWNKFKPNDISKYQNITYQIAKEKLTKINWSIASKHKLDESTIELASEYVNWQVICKRQRHLSEEFLTKFHKRIHWDNTSIYQRLTPAFIRKFIKKLNIQHLSQYQNMPIDLIKELEDKLDFDKLSKNKHYNKPGTIQILTNGKNYFVIEPPIIGKIARVNFVNLEGELV